MWEIWLGYIILVNVESGSDATLAGIVERLHVQVIPIIDMVLNHEIIGMVAGEKFSKYLQEAKRMAKSSIQMTT